MQKFLIFVVVALIFNQALCKDLREKRQAVGQGQNVFNVNSASYRQCLRTCPSTTEYNPVCGSDNVTYDNPGRLNCAQMCGNNIATSRLARCPTPAA